MHAPADRERGDRRHVNAKIEDRRHVNAEIGGREQRDHRV
jgi:hypothetical protein